MLAYKGSLVDEKLEPFGTADEFGYRTTGETSNLSGRVDFGGVDAPLMGGVFRATKGSFEAAYSYHEHICIHHGEVAITDGDGERRVFQPGNSWIIRKGEVVQWEVLSDFMIKTFISSTLDLD